ncbi:MAG TPA: tetratricopeptide repeat protein [Polyangia bacterium]|nr:tetratricopeptide repeat protein [Polyangia bacterium]
MCDEGRFEEAIVAAGAELAAAPGEPEAHFNRGQALAALDRFDEAAADYERALGLDASASALDPEAVDDELFFALRRQAERLAPDRAAAVATLGRYLEILPEGRHVADVPKWIDKLEGREAIWVREKI